MDNPRTTMWLEVIIVFAFVALVLFLTAGTINYWQAWIYLGVGIATSIPLTLYIIKDPVLLQNRTGGGSTSEPRAIQRIIVLFLVLPVIAAILVPGLDHRFGWSHMPSWLSLVGDLIIVISMWMVYRVFKENSFGSTTVKVTTNQRVISTGP